MEEDEDDENYSDDDDVSWKVRRAAAKVLSAALVSRPDKLAAMVPRVAPTLISRFREREENVKMDVFATFNVLLEQVGIANRAASEAAAADAMAVDGEGCGAVSPAATALLAELPRLIKALSRQLQEKAVRTRTAAFNCLRQLASSLPSCLGEHASSLVPGVVRALKDASANPLRIEALAFLQLALSTHPPAVFQPHAATLVPTVLSLVEDRYYKITAEALRVSAELARVLRPSPPDPPTFDFAALVAPLFTCVSARLVAQDQDQEVKERAIECVGAIVCRLGDLHAEALPALLPVLLERMRNEMTRIAAVKTFALLAAAKVDAQLASPLAGTGGSVLQAVVGELANFLRKSDKPLRQAALSALDTIVTCHAAALTPADYDGVLEQMPPLLSDADLHVAHLALGVARSLVLQAADATVPKLAPAVVPRTLSLLQSPLLQGYALKSALDFLAALVAHGAKPLDFSSLTERILALVDSDGTAASRHSLGVLSQAIAACATEAKAPLRASTVDAFVKQLGAPSESPHKRVLALICLGEIGAKNDLSAHKGLLPAVMAAFDVNEEEYKAAASYALGHVAAGSLSFYLPHLLKEVEAGKHEYLMLSALNELAKSGGASLAAVVPQLLPTLFTFAERDEEGVRNVIAECIGRLAAAAPGPVLPELESRLSHASPNVRLVVVHALRFTLTEEARRAVPPSTLHKFLGALGDEDLKVRRGALLTLNCIAHSRPATLREPISGGELLPLLYGETAKRAELVHQVDLGPFKHFVDDGLELRKAAFECMDTLLSKPVVRERLELSPFVARLAEGLSDDADIKMRCHAMLVALSALPAGQPVLTGALDTLLEPLRKTLLAQLKDNAVPQQVERHDDLVRSAMRAVRALERLPEAETVPKLGELVRNTLKAGRLADKYAAVCAEEEAKPADGE
mmetsp:Transcript_50664/g.169198  ORF Transcript_50664/g.169198 Transcript_50664/m.169198 type:complete len:920 (+) Transcript_50664:2-2761(+)